MSIITVVTDFGSGSPYPAEVRGVLAARCRAAVVDITHDVPARDVRAGAYVLAAAASRFPAGTVHLAVVDPGVGTARRAIAATGGGHVFVAPDNGLLTRALTAAASWRAVAIDVERFALPSASATFHGRDVFAPVAGALAAGMPIDRAGASVDDLIWLTEREPRRTVTALRGTVIYQDRFGNLVTNIPGIWLSGARVAAVVARRLRVRARTAHTYADGGAGEMLVLVGSDATIEIAINGGDASKRLSLGPGDEVALETGRAGTSGRRSR
jgi:hypothetical protein